MGGRKRPITETEEEVDTPPVPELIQRLRNMWEFVNFYQFLMIFAHLFKIKMDFDLEVRRAPPPYPSLLLIYDVIASLPVTGAR